MMAPCALIAVDPTMVWTALGVLAALNLLSLVLNLRR